MCIFVHVFERFQCVDGGDCPDGTQIFVFSVRYEHGSIVVFVVVVVVGGGGGVVVVVVGVSRDEDVRRAILSKVRRRGIKSHPGGWQRSCQSRPSYSHYSGGWIGWSKITVECQSIFS